jgi:Ala-tRNA(Pro) deacylase
MVVVPGDCHVDVDKVGQQLHRRLHLATEADFAHLFRDCEARAIPPLGPCYGIETIVDDRLLQQNEICFVSGDHDELIRVDREVFLTLVTGARITRLPTAI